MGIKNAPCLLTFAGSWLLYLAYMGHSVSFIPCQMCVRIDVLNFWERSGLVCVLWRNCLLFCVMRCRELRVFLRSAEFLFKTQHWIPSDCREVGIIWQKWARQFPCAGKGGSKDKGWDDCGQGWAGGRLRQASTGRQLACTLAGSPGWACPEWGQGFVANFWCKPHAPLPGECFYCWKAIDCQSTK